MTSENIECPHCLVAVHVRWNSRALQTVRADYEGLGWHAVTTPCASCNELIVRIVKRVLTDDGERVVEIDRLVHPPGRSRPTVDSEAIPQALKEDYLEACEVLEISPKASAVLSRRVLQGILKEQGYDSRNLHQQIIDVLAQDGPAALTGSLRDTIDVIRHFGNFSAHPITQETTLHSLTLSPMKPNGACRLSKSYSGTITSNPTGSERRLEKSAPKSKRMEKSFFRRKTRRPLSVTSATALT